MASFELYMANHTLAVRNALVEKYMPLLKAVVASISKGRIRRGDSSYVCTDDLEAAGVVGLIKGVEQFDPLRGLQPQTFLSAKIRSAVLDELRRLDPLSRADRRLCSADDAASADPARQRKIARGLSLGAAAPITEAHREELEAPAGVESVKEALKAAFQGLGPRRTYALVLHQFEDFSVRGVHAALIGKPEHLVRHASPSTVRILRSSLSDLRANVDLANGRATKIVTGLLKGCPRQGREDHAVSPRPRERT